MWCDVQTCSITITGISQIHVAQLVELWTSAKWFRWPGFESSSCWSIFYPSHLKYFKCSFCHLNFIILSFKKLKNWLQRISPHHGPLVLDIFSFRWISFWSTIQVCFYVIEELLPVFSDKSFLEKQSLIEAERRFFKERNKEIVDKLMKNTPKEELDSVEFKVSVTVYIFIIKSTYENVVKVSLWADSTATCPDKSRNYIIMLNC